MKNLCKTLIVILLAVNLQAATNWVAPNDTAADWAEPLNWSEGVPTSSDIAIVNNHGTVEITAAGAVCNGLYMGASENAGGTVNMIGGSLDIADAFWMGRTGGCKETYFNLSDGELTVYKAEIGMKEYCGHASFNQTGGIYSNQTNIVIARDGIGSYTISGGTLNTNVLYVGVNGEGLLRVEGDSPVINITNFRVYGNSTFEAVIDPNVSPLNIADTAYFPQSGAKLNIIANNAQPGRYDIIKAATLTGTSNLEVNLPNNHWSWGATDGTLWVEYDNSALSTTWVGEEDNPISWSSTAHWSNGEPEITDSAIINNHRTVEVVETGEACNKLYMGAVIDGGGTVNMYSGSLAIANDFWMGRTGGSGESFFNLSGGDLIIEKSILGLKADCGLSSLTQTGGTFSAGSWIKIADQGPGAYIISAGQFQAPTLYIASGGGEGYFEVDGSGSNIEIGSFNLYEMGTVVSKIGTDGISVINVSGNARLHSGNATWSIVNDGAAAGKYDIMTADSYTGFSNLSLNLPDDKWSWGITGDTVWVEYSPDFYVDYSYPGLPCQMTIEITIPQTSANEITLSYGQDTLDSSVVVQKDIVTNSFVYTFTDLEPAKQYTYQIDDGGSLFSGSFSAEATLPDTFIIEDFERFTSTEELVDDWLVYPYGSEQFLITEPNSITAYDGSQCVKYYNHEGGQFSSGIYLNNEYESLDISQYDKLRIWYRGDASNLENIKMEFDIRSLQYDNVFIKELAPVKSNYDKWICQDFEIDSTDPNWADIKGIYLRVYSSGQPSTVYLDRIEAVRETNISNDYNGDLFIGEYDLMQIASSWLAGTDFIDFAQISNNWLADYSCGFEDLANIYVSPDGSGSGRSPFEAASLYDQSMWRTLNVRLREHPVTVWLLDGTYDGSRQLRLLEIGNDTNALTIKAQNPGGVVFDPQSFVTDNLIYLRRCKNVIVDGLEFTGENILNYSIALGYSSNIQILNCNFYDLTATEFGVFGAHRGCDNILVQNCTFERCGVDSLSHFVYNAYGDPTNINIDGCSFEDCSGSYVRFRDGGNGSSVTNCTFTSTGTYPEPSKLTYIQMATFNDREPEEIEYDEYFGTDFTFTGNTFDFTNVATQDKRAIDFLHQGYDPRGDNPNTSDGDNQWHYLMTAADGAILEGSDASAKRNLLYNECGIDYNQLNISSNTYIGQTIILGFESKAAYGAVSQGWDSVADITDILN